MDETAGPSHESETINDLLENEENVDLENESFGS